MTGSPLAWEPDPTLAEIGSRALFPELGPRVYLSHAACSPPSSEVRRGIECWLSDWASRGVAAVPTWLEQRSRLRARLARLIGTTADRIALVPSTTSAVLSVAHCFDWRPKDRVLCLRGEFPTNVTPWQRAAATFDLEMTYLEANDFRSERGLDALDDALARGVRLVAISAVQFQTGLRMPLDTIISRAHARGASVFVDAMQSTGVVPLDVAASGADFVGVGSHKWLMGLEGAGFLYAKDERSLVPRWAGWQSHEDAFRFLFEGPGELRYDRPLLLAPGFLECGAANSAGFVALEAGLASLEKIGVPAIFDHVQRYHDALEPGLVERGFKSERAKDVALRSGILSFVPPAPHRPADLVRALGERGVAISGPDGRVRFAPHWPNALSEVDGVLEAIDDVLAG